MSERTVWPHVPVNKALCEGCEENPADLGDFLCPECREAERAESEWWQARQERLRDWADEDHEPAEVEPIEDAWEERDA
jgi:hypothetical protein